MSIINEALKKTEQSIQRNSNPNNIPLKKESKLKPILLYIIILLAGLFLGNLLLNLLHAVIKPTLPPIKPISLSTLQPSATPPAAPTPTTLPATEEVKTQTIPKQTFVLNGIFYSDNDGYALVNNQIVRENDLVDGAKIIKITTNSVELDQEGNITTLTTPR